MQFDQDTIKDLAVYSVQQFVSNKVPLDVSIAEKARSLKLNEDQVRRVVESTNVIAFLKLREGAEDKTFEFEVASFDGVMTALMGSSSHSQYEEPVPEPELHKAAFTVSANVSTDQAHQTLYKLHRHAIAEIEKVAQEHYNCVSDLERLVPALVKQAHWQERLEYVSGTDFDRIMTAFGKSGFEKSASENSMVFVGRELEVANQVVELIKEAASLQARRVDLEGLEKKALLGLGKLLRAGKYFAKDPIAGAAAAVTAIPAAAASAGIKAGKAATGSFKRSAISGGTVATVGLTAATYTPKINPRTGRPNDVLNNIYD